VVVAPAASSLAALTRRRRALKRATSSPKTRVGGPRRNASGRTWNARAPRRGIAPGCAAYGYESASGRRLFLNRDPIEEAGGLNLYGFCGNDGVNNYDYLGMKGVWNWFTAKTDSATPVATDREDTFDRIFRTGGVGPDGMSGDTYWQDNLFTYTLYGQSLDRSLTVERYFSNGIGMSPRTTAEVEAHAQAEATERGIKPGTVVSIPITRNGKLIGYYYSAVSGGGGEIGTYLVRMNAAGQWIVVGKTDGVTTEHAYLNGILGSLARHAYLGGKHVQHKFGNQVTEYTLFNNPSKGFFRDIRETALDKLGLTTDVAKMVAAELQKIQSSGRKVEWIAHSQGGAIFAEAMRYVGGDLSANSVTFNAGANNRWITNRIAAEVAVRVDGYSYSVWDAVPSVIGVNGGVFSMLGSVLASPLLFMNENISPHTLPSSRWRTR